jgi:hypothetical protein
MNLAPCRNAALDLLKFQTTNGAIRKIIARFLHIWPREWASERAFMERLAATRIDGVGAQAP